MLTIFNCFLNQLSSTNSRSTYERGLSRFAHWAADNGVTIETLKVRDIKAYRVWLTDALGPSSVNVYLSALRSFLKWAAGEELVSTEVYSATTVVSNVKTPERLPSVLRAEEVDDLLCLPDPTTLNGARDLALLALLVSTGLRISEAISIDIETIDFSKREIRVIGKGDKERIVLFGKNAADAVRNYLTLRSNPVEGPLFINKFGKRISVRYCQQQISGYGVRLNGENLHPHTLRHTFATQFLDATGDLAATQDLLGHSRAETTRIYTKTATNRLRRQYDKLEAQNGALETEDTNERKSHQRETTSRKNTEEAVW